jgi:hypothetical protein
MDSFAVEMLANVRAAMKRLVLEIAQGKAPKRISMPGGEMVEAQDSDKLLAVLEKMERIWEVRVEGRQGGRLTP